MAAAGEQTRAVEARGRLVSYMRLITAGGALAMVYMTCTGSPVTTDFVRDLGGTEFHFGLLSGIPLILIALQFWGALFSGRIRQRKPWFMALLIAGRLLYLPAAFLPLWLPGVRGTTWVYVFIVCVAIQIACANLATPLWFSWMADLIPGRILNRYWGARHRYLQLVWTACFLAVAAFSYYADRLPSRVMFPILAAIGVVAGTIDIVLFTWVREPANIQTGHRRTLEVLTEPLRNRDYRSLIGFHCAFTASTMLAAAFMQLYVLKVLDLPRWKVTLLWCIMGFGNAVVAQTWGRIADRFGHRPVLRLCVALKPVVCLAFMLVTAQNAFRVLGAVFFFDSMVNAGYFIAVNGYCLKTAPRENRSMYVATAQAFAGIAGGIAAIAAGWLLRHTPATLGIWAGRAWTNYHLIFALSLIGRLVCIRLAATVREASSAPTVKVLAYLGGLWPMRLLAVPVGLLRARGKRFRGGTNRDSVPRV